jgi:hypothetical protein
MRLLAGRSQPAAASRGAFPSLQLGTGAAGQPEECTIMTNSEIQKHAARYAAQRALEGRVLDPEEAWYLWAAEHGMSDSPGARHLFEAGYQSQLKHR